VTCLACGNPDTTAEPGEDVAEHIDAGRPGASALREYQRRHDAREQRAQEKLGGLGVFLAKVIDEPASTRAWQQGGKGEVRTGARLEQLLDGTGVHLLHDRRVPGHGKANIDHIAVGPGGVTVIDSKTHRGKIRRDSYGGLFVERRTILRIDGRDQTKLITGIEKQIGYVRAAVAGLNLGTRSTSPVRSASRTSTACRSSGGSRSAGSSSTARSRSRSSPPDRDDSTPTPSSGSARISSARFPPPDRP
jgi:hypothetical protein